MAMKKGTMVLEGGAVRGVFTAGALDYLMEKNLYLSHVIGVSAGACNAVDYVSEQPGRSKECMIHKDKEYSYFNTNIKKFVKSKSLLDMDMFFEKFPREIYPFDFDTYFKSKTKCLLTVTNCITGKAEYLTEDSDEDRLLRLCRASSSIPLGAPIVNIDDTPYLDGGLADAVPIKKALELGNDKIVVILTRNAEYVKKPLTKGMSGIYQKAYKKYPELVKTLRIRYARYNKTTELINALEKEGKIFVLRPEIDAVGRLDSDYEKIIQFYQHGYDLMESQYESLLEYLKK